MRRINTPMTKQRLALEKAERYDRHVRDIVAFLNETQRHAKGQELSPASLYYLRTANLSYGDLVQYKEWDTIRLQVEGAVSLVREVRIPLSKPLPPVTTYDFTKHPPRQVEPSIESYEFRTEKRVEIYVKVLILDANRASRYFLSTDLRQRSHWPNIPS